MSPLLWQCLSGTLILVFARQLSCVFSLSLLVPRRAAYKAALGCLQHICCRTKARLQQTNARSVGWCPGGWCWFSCWCRCCLICRCCLSSTYLPARTGCSIAPAYTTALWGNVLSSTAYILYAQGLFAWTHACVRSQPNVHVPTEGRPERLGCCSGGGVGVFLCARVTCAPTLHPCVCISCVSCVRPLSAACRRVLCGGPGQEAGIERGPSSGELAQSPLNRCTVPTCPLAGAYVPMCPRACVLVCACTRVPMWGWRLTARPLVRSCCVCGCGCGVACLHLQVIVGLLLQVIFWAGANFFIYAWALVAGFTLVMMAVFPVSDCASLCPACIASNAINMHQHASRDPPPPSGPAARHCVSHRHSMRTCACCA